MGGADYEDVFGVPRYFIFYSKNAVTLFDKEKFIGFGLWDYKTYAN
jgi:hypothetical protein